MTTLHYIQEIANSSISNDSLGRKVRDYLEKIYLDTNNFIKCIHCGKYQPPISHICQFCNRSIYEEDTPCMERNSVS